MPKRSDTPSSISRKQQFQFGVLNKSYQAINARVRYNFLMKLTKALLLTLFVLISGCSSFQPRPLSPAQEISAFDNRSLENVGLKEFMEKNLHQEISPWPPDSWDLSMLMLAAFYYHPDLDVARAKWLVAEAKVITAGGRPNPTFGFTPQYDANSPPGLTPWTLGFSFDIPLETAGKRGCRVAQAKALSEAARLNIASMAWQVRSRVRARLVDLYVARQQEAILKKQLAAREDLTRFLEKRFSAGMLALPIMTDVRIAKEKTQLLFNDARRQSVEAIMRLADSLGLSDHALDGVDISFDLIDHLPRDYPTKEARR